MSQELDDLAFRFFKLFAQCEFALKMMGYGKARPNGAAESDWDKFANEVGAGILNMEQAEVVAARTYLLEHPPKRQVWQAGAVAWQEVANEEKTPQALFSHIRRVRNNLYHGGKFNGRWFEPERSEALISNSLLLLQVLVDSDQRLSEAVRGNAG